MEKKEKGCVDLAKTLGRSFISGAYDIERRVHWSAFIYTEWSHYDNELYLEIHREKVKYKKTPVDYLVQWLQNGFIIHDDYGTDQYNSRDTIMPKDENINFTQGAADVGVRGITSIAKMKGDMGIKDNNTPQSTTSTAPQPMTFEQETTPIQNTSSLPSLMTEIPNTFGMNFFSVDVPTAFTYSNPFEMNNYKVAFQGNDTVEYIMPDVSYGVTPFNC
jgi:type IV secretory pathway VirB4 component